MALKCDAVFQGGGVRGIAFVGAVSAIQKAGYEFENVAGTSAGAIVAALIAAGYKADELEVELQKVDYTKFKDKDLLDKLPLGEALSTIIEFGIYEGNYFESWLDRLLQAKGKTTFGDIRMDNPSQEKFTYKFQAIAADLTEKRLLVLPGDLKDFGYDPDQYSISRAVRMSMSIPVFFEPVKLTDSMGNVHYIVDGGVLSNYPIWLLDDGTSDPPWPTFGFKLTDSTEHAGKAYSGSSIRNILQYMAALVSTMMDGNDNYHISESRGDFDRTMVIPTTVEVDGTKKKIRTTDFNITHEESKGLFNNGLEIAEDFLKTWDFDAWKKRYREK